MSNYYAVLSEREPVAVYSPSDIMALVKKHGRKNVAVSWKSVTQPDRVVKRRIYSVVAVRETAKGVLMTIKISRKKYRSLYFESVTEVVVD